MKLHTLLTMAVDGVGQLYYPPIGKEPQCFETVRAE
jgi:hypothetical protein